MRRPRGWRGLARRVTARRTGAGPHGLGRARATCARSATWCSTSACSACWSAFAAGKIFGYEGQVIVLSGGGQFCNTGILGYDSFRPGLRVDGTELQPVLRAGRRLRRHLPAQRAGRRATAPAVGYQTGRGPRRRHRRPGGRYRSRSTARCASTATGVYLLGHGYAPRFTVTFPDGQQRTGEIQWRPGRPDHAAVGGRHEVRPARASRTRSSAARSQLAVTGLLAPDQLRRRGASPRCSRRCDDPEVAVDVLRGDLGPGRRARPVDLHGRPEQARHGRADAGGAGEHAAGRRDHAGRRHRGPLRRRRATGCRCRSATTRRRCGCWCSRCFVLVGLVLSLRPAPPVLGAADAARRRGRHPWSSSAGSPAPTAPGYGEEFDRLAARAARHARIPGETEERR